MLCYRDRQFCSFWHDCRDATLCGRALTPDVEAKAKKLGLGIDQTPEAPDCFVDTYYDGDPDATDMLHLIAMGVI